MDVDRGKLDTGFEAKIFAGFAVAVLVVAGVVGTTWHVARQASVASQWVAHSRKVLDGLAHIKLDTLQIEFTTQAFRVTGDTARLVERDTAVADRETNLNAVHTLLADNAPQLGLWTQLRQVINQRIAFSREIEILRKTQGEAAAAAFVATAPLQQTRALTYRLLGDMDGQERALLDARTVEETRASQALVAADGAVAVLLMGLLAAIYFLIRRQLKESEASRHALAQSEESLSTTLMSIGDAVVATDTAGRVTRMNPVAERLTGWPLAQARGKPIGDVFHIVHEQTRATVEIPVHAVLATGKVQGLANHTALIARDGSECPIADSAAPIFDSAGVLNGVVLVFHDVTIEAKAQRTIEALNQLLERRVRERTVQLGESEGHLRSVIASVPVLIAYVDAQERYVYVNDQYRERFAPDRQQFAGCTVREILGDERYAVAKPRIDMALQGLAQSYDWQPFADVWQTIDYMPRRDETQRVVGYYVLGRDTTERKAAEERISSLNVSLEERVRELERVSRALKTLSAGNRTMLRAISEQELLDTMCESIVGASGYRMASVWYRVDDASKALRPMAQNGHPGGMAALALQKKTWDDSEYGRGATSTAIRTGQTSVVRDVLTDPNYALLRAQLPGCRSGISCPLRIYGDVVGALAIYASETEAFGPDEVALLTESADDLAFGITTLRSRAQQEKSNEAVYRLTHYDTLTGLPNETHFNEILSDSIDRGQRLKQPFVVLQTNIERLREINDALGFSYGDQLLREFSLRVCSAAPMPAIVARLRGDEFAILLPGCVASEAPGVVDKLAAALKRPFALADIFLDVSARTGATLFPDFGRTPHDLYRQMDIAVHTAKSSGAPYALYDPAQYQDQSGRLNLAGELSRAIEAGHLMLYLQPKVDFATGRVCAAEGLVRWRHATRGLIMPGEFIALAEHTGLIKPLTEWVIEAALRLNHDWKRMGCELPIAVNLSARNLRDEGLLERIRQLQSTWDVPKGLLELEITESTVMDDADFALRALQGLRDEGIPLYIDDFGTGYSSLSYLQKLPMHYIKIDQSFVRDMAKSADSAVIVRSTIDLAHDLGRKVVAEGIETQGDWDQLAAFGCDVAQGYFIARPMPAEEFPAWVKQFVPPTTQVPK